MKTPERIDLFNVLLSEYSIEFGYYYLTKGSNRKNTALPVLRVFEQEPTHQEDELFVVNSSLFQTIEDGDIGLSNGKGQVRVLLSRRANQNTLLLTERCDNRCMFCSQPPKDANDKWLLELAEKALIDFDFNGVIGLSGGEPLLYGEDLYNFLQISFDKAPHTKFHILSNGRGFKNPNFTDKLASLLDRGDIVFGVPIYGASADTHDLLVGEKGAFFDTVAGLINAGNLGIPIELRIIPTKLNYYELPAIVEFAVRVFSSISQISIMNLEPTGWAKKNWSELYMRPSQYKSQLKDSIQFLRLAEVPVALFNYPLCHLESSIRQYAVKSISDWKNFYPEECDNCLERSTCGGYFISTNGDRYDPPRSIR